MKSMERHTARSLSGCTLLTEGSSGDAEEPGPEPGPSAARGPLQSEHSSSGAHSASLPHRFPWTSKLWTQQAAAVVACFLHGASSETLSTVRFLQKVFILTCRVADGEMHLHYRSHSSNGDSERRESTIKHDQLRIRGVRRAILGKSSMRSNPAGQTAGGWLD